MLMKITHTQTHTHTHTHKARRTSSAALVSAASSAKSLFSSSSFASTSNYSREGEGWNNTCNERTRKKKRAQRDTGRARDERQRQAEAPRANGVPIQRPLRKARPVRFGSVRFAVFISQELGGTERNWVPLSRDQRFKIRTRPVNKGSA